jgi:hypothetical protein
MNWLGGLLLGFLALFAFAEIWMSSVVTDACLKLMN